MSAASSPEAQILSRIKEDHLTCQICQGPYILPKALPCLHTFCAQCLTDFVYSRRYDIDGMFKCPVCRTRVTLPKEGVEGFPDNHLVITLMDTVQNDDQMSPVAAAAAGPLYPDLNQLMSDAGLKSPKRPAPAPPKPSRNGTPPARPAPPRTTRNNNATATVQRRLQLSGDAYPVPVVLDRHGAEVSFGQYGAGLTDFTQPVGLAVSPEGHVVVGDQRDCRVFVFERSGRLKSMFTCQGQIQDLSISSTGLVYIANTQAKRSLVTCYNTRGHTIATFGHFFTYEKPHGVAVTQDNHMAVTSTDTHQVYILNEYGKMTHKFVGKGKDGTKLRYPYHVTVSKKNRVVVSDYGNDCIKVFDMTGKCKVQFGKYGAKPGQLNGPRGVCTDKDDNILVADSRNHRVQVFSAKGQFLGVAMLIGREDAGIGACPMNIEVTRDQRLVVLFSGGSFAQIRVYKYQF